MISRRTLVITAVTAIAGLSLTLMSCSSIGFYSQAVSGHLKLMSARQPIEKLLKSDTTDPKLRQKLQELADARAFAVETLKLPNNDSYSTYAETGRAYVTWNVVAAEEFALRPKTWCFPVAGCVSYKGYFKEQDAIDYAAELAAEQYDVTVGGASAYSTLGWFDDPVLDTMLKGSDIRYVSTLFHELAHQVLYVKNDSNFNEAFASFVEQQGFRLWLESQGQSKRIGQYESHLARSIDFNQLLQTTQKQLRELYALTLDEDTMRQRKQSVFDQMQKSYAQLKVSWGGFSGYDGWFAKDVNNARLLAVATYRQWVPAFAALYKQQGSDMEAFFAEARKLSELPYEERQAVLEQLLKGDSE